MGLRYHLQVGINFITMTILRKTTKYHNGDPIASVTENTAWGNLSTGAYCFYNNEISNKDTYGALYNWYAVNDSRKIAPEGWHSATEAEWTSLISYLGEESIAGGKMKSTSSLWQSVNVSATNKSGFSGLPGGSRAYDGDFESILRDRVFWSSTKENDEWAINFFLHYDNSDCTSYGRLFQAGYSIRCIKD